MTSVSTIVANIWHVDAPARGIWRRMAQTRKSALALLRTNVLRTLSLRARMGILVIAGVVPLLLLDLGVVYTDYLSDREHAGDQALNLARRVAVSVESELRMRIGILEVLTMSRALAAGDLVTFRSEVEAVIARQSPGANIVLLREDGQQLMNTALPSGLPLPKRQNLENQQRVFATGRPSVSDIYVGVVVGKPVVAIDVPVLRADGSVGLILALNPTFDALSSLIVSPTPNEGWIITLIDRVGGRIARDPSIAGLVAQVVQPDFLQSWSTHREGILAATSAEGWPVLVAFSRLTEPAWGVSVAVPTVQLTWPAWQAALTSIASGLTLLALGLWLAYWISRSVSEPISVLRRIAAASDHFSGPLIAARTGLPEAEEVAEVLRAESRRRVTEKAHLERTLAERTDALAQRDLLLREVHHRVKNNLQMVDGLLAIEVRQLSDNEARQALSVLRSRVHALGLVHEQLMQSADLRTFDIAPFLHELCHNIVAGSTNRSVSVNVEVSTLMVTLDFAIPVGLLVTELVTNCFKHLPTEGDGHISVILRRSTTGLALTVSDDGLCPIAPIGPVNAKEGQGMKIIRGLVEQLDGVMDMRYDNGYRTDIVLELEDTLYG